MLKTLKKINTTTISLPKVGDIVKGKIITRDRNALFLDLGANGIGVILGKDFYNAKNSLKNLKQGDELSAKLINLETDEGYRELSFIEARQELAWQELEQAKDNNETFEVLVQSANKGGLICQLKDINGFLPTSQLLPEHYPKVEKGDPVKIAKELQKLVGKKIKVKIFSVSQREQKLILSEKINAEKQAEQELMNYKIGDKVEGKISGITNFGAFMKFDKNLEGLIESPEIIKYEEKNEPLKMYDELKAEILKIQDDKIYLKPLKKQKLD